MLRLSNIVLASYAAKCLFYFLCYKLDIERNDLILSLTLSLGSPSFVFRSGWYNVWFNFILYSSTDFNHAINATYSTHISCGAVEFHLWMERKCGKFLMYNLDN